MKKIEKRLKQDLIDSMDVNLEFDTNQLEIEEIEIKEKKKFNKKAWIPTLSSVGLAAIACAIIIPSLVGPKDPPEPIDIQDSNIKPTEEKLEEPRSNFEFKKGAYKENVISNALIEKSLNYELIEARNTAWEFYQVSDEFKQAMYNFANTSYNALEKKENISYCPYGVYSILNNLELATTSATNKALIDSVLGMNQQERKQNIINANKTDYFVNEVGTLQVNNASFQTSEYTPNPEYVNDLTSYGIEGYSIDFTNDNDVKVMLDWVDQKLNEQGFLKKQDILKNPAATTLVLLSTLYFRNNWRGEYKEVPLGPTFMNNNETEEVVQYMNHVIEGSYYDYGDYFTFRDYFYNGQSVKFIVAKNPKTSIYDYVENENLFIDDESKRYSEVMLDVTIPEFSYETFLNLNDTLKSIGLSPLYQNGCFNRPFLNCNSSMSLSNVIQKNKVTFNDKGAEIKSVTGAGIEKESMPPLETTSLEIKVQNPFIYIVYDANNLPLFIGHVDNIKPVTE